MAAHGAHHCACAAAVGLSRQQEDLTALGRLLLWLATGAVVALTRDAVAQALAMVRLPRYANRGGDSFNLSWPAAGPW